MQKNQNLKLFKKNIKKYLIETVDVLHKLDHDEILKFIEIILKVKKKKGRIFVIGLGGSAANASHLVNDFRKFLDIDTICPLDNVSELSANINDIGWSESLYASMKVSKISKKDAILVLSVGGGNKNKKISTNIIYALQKLKKVGCAIIGIVGRDGGYTKKIADRTILVPTVNQISITPHAEVVQSVIWHLIVTILTIYK